MCVCVYVCKNIYQISFLHSKSVISDKYTHTHTHTQREKYWMSKDADIINNNNINGCVQIFRYSVYFLLRIEYEKMYILRLLVGNVESY